QSFAFYANRRLNNTDLPSSRCQYFPVSSTTVVPVFAFQAPHRRFIIINALRVPPRFSLNEHTTPFSQLFSPSSPNSPPAHLPSPCNLRAQRRPPIAVVREAPLYHNTIDHLASLQCRNGKRYAKLSPVQAVQY
ncbi:unnamed protein product, partial [Ectocarpus sp. 13 AM-2016]